MRILVATILCLGVCRGGEPTASAWTEFRNGGSSTSTAEMPVSWSLDNGIAWQIELQGYGQSSPVVLNGRIFVTSVVGPMKDVCQVTCFDLKTGEQIWVWSQDASQKAASNYMASRAAPTPMVDEQGVYAFFESGDLVSINHDGSLKWKRSLTNDYGPFENNHGLGSSPTQTSELVVVNIEHKGPSYLLAVAKRTGENRWKAERPSGSSWTSPIVIQRDGKEQVIVSSAGAVDSYSSADGTKLWSVGGLSGSSVPSPTAVGPYLFVGARIPEFGSAQEASRSNLCLRINASSEGQQEVVWRASKAVCDYASPVIHGDCAYYLNNVGVLHCVNAVTGETHYTERLGTTCWATPVISGDKVFFFGKDGTTQVIASGPVFTKVASNTLWDPKNPPAPESYKEHQGGGHGNGDSPAESGSKGEASDAGSEAKGSETQGGPGRRGGRGGGMIAALMKGDANGDGNISAEELPPEFKEMMPRIDTNKDNVIDAAELKAMEESFRKRREGSQESARDPIVYGVAAADGAFVIRTGTRLYCVRGK